MMSYFWNWDNNYFQITQINTDHGIIVAFFLLDSQKEDFFGDILNIYIKPSLLCIAFVFYHIPQPPDTWKVSGDCGTLIEKQIKCKN